MYIYIYIYIYVNMYMWACISEISDFKELHL